MGIGTKEIIIIAIVFIILFGAKKIPELAKSLSDSIKHIRGAFKDNDLTVGDGKSGDSKKK